jgi:hypothetical protein
MEDTEPRDIPSKLHGRATGAAVLNTGSPPRVLYLGSIASEMTEEWIEIVPAQRRAAGESAYKSWLAAHGLRDADLAHDVMLEIGRMVGGGDFVCYSVRASRLAELGITPEIDTGNQ